MRRKLLFLFLVPLLAFTSLHKYYVSTTQIKHSEKDEALQVITRVFIDDMERLLEMRYDIKAKLATEDESPMADNYLKKYFLQKMSFKINGKEASIDFLGKEYEDDMIKCYIEVPNVKGIKSIEVVNEILFDAFEEQQNIVHFKLQGKRKSFILIKDNDKALLNF
ncbi:DUF6702 family protein [Sungkyunkwania multivorans]|uniref:DUF6702 family protein n=1 Tax=Sungkyunkwania multivorans TaxID=1173618 RepID=A0ABW3CXZ1_9FLAO